MSSQELIPVISSGALPRASVDHHISILNVII
jgi:hypothetical protein